MKPINVQRLFDCYVNRQKKINPICRKLLLGIKKIEAK